MKTLDEVKIYFETVLFNDLKKFETKRLILLPIAILFRVIMASIFLVIITNVFNAFLTSGMPNLLIYFIMAFFLMILAMILINPFFEKYFDFFDSFWRKFFVIAAVALIFYFIIRLLKYTPLFFMDFGKELTFDYFFSYAKNLGKIALLIVILIPILLIYNKYEKRFRIAFKKEVLKRLFNFINPDLIYEAEKFISKTEFKKSKLFYKDPTYKYSGTDYINGTIGETRFEFSQVEAQIKETTRTAKGTKTQIETIFNGILYKADFNKNFNGETFVKPDISERIFGAAGTALQRINTGQGELAKMDNAEFEKVFVVHTTDQVEARYILSTSMLERLLNLYKELKKAYSVSFVESQIYIAIPLNKDFFAPSIFGKVISYRQIERFYNQFTLLTGLVDELNLNTRIWTKQ